MVYISDLQQLVTQWMERVDCPAHPSSYKDALSECIYELNSLINNTLLDELTEQEALDYLASVDAEHLSNLEPEEFYATAV